ncbi:MAG: cytochrome-c oxidase [Alphaproteobacteria bacterium]|nr:MAG: cytochrome-c oxidase [Alphaproteobacteria bacterium]
MLAERFIKSAVIYVIIGMALGVHMGMSQDHSQMPAHAHINLVGWVSMALMGLIYKTWPKTGEHRLAPLTFWLAHLGLIVMIAGVAMIYAGHAEFEPVAGIGSLITFANMLLFAFLVWRGLQD